MTRVKGGRRGKPHGERHNLKARQEAYDASGKSRGDGFTRPGSTNRKKQA